MLPDSANVTITADIKVFIDNGLPFELPSCDIMADLRPVVDAEWQVDQARQI